MDKSLYWADQIASNVIRERGNKKKYTTAAGITPSGTVHIGNFREIITVDLVTRALKSKNKAVRFIYSWDDYDRFRKIPKNMPKQEILKNYLGRPIVDTPDTFGCHKSYAEHLEKELELSLPAVGINPEFIYQNKIYRASKYAEEIKRVLLNKEIIIEILNKYRKEPLPSNWSPAKVYCEKCNTDNTSILKFDGNYTVEYNCQCGHTGTVNFKKKGNIKLSWRVDWPMRWHYESVDFEPGGKEHSTPGGSRTTAVEILDAVYHEKPPVYAMYDFVILKGIGGKMSSSAGNVITLGDCLQVYFPEIVRYLFASTKPKKEFSLSFDEDVIKVYEDYYEAERIYFGKKNVSEKDKAHWSRVYELSQVDKLVKTIPIQPSFRHAIELINIHQTVKQAIASVKTLEKISKKADIDRYTQVLTRAEHWLEKYAPERFKFQVQEKPAYKPTGDYKKAVTELSETLTKIKQEDLLTAVKDICYRHNIQMSDFFKVVYQIVLDREQGPRFAPLVAAVGKIKVAKLLKAAIT